MSSAWQQAEPASSIPAIEPDRRYTNAPYLLPTDEQEIQRMDFQHYALRAFCHGQLAFAPALPQLPYPHILDVGTGSGRWAIDLALSNIGAQVWGVDIIEPPTYMTGMVPGNCHLQYGNVLEHLPFPSQSYDYVHQRMINFGVPQAQWQHVLTELLGVTRMGGWLELMEWTGTVINPPPKLAELVEWVQRAAWQGNGIDLRMGSQVANMLLWSHCSNVRKMDLHMPMGAHGGRIGKLIQMDSLALIRGVAPLIAKCGIATLEQVKHHLAAVEVDLANPACQSYLPFMIAIGQRTP